MKKIIDTTLLREMANAIRSLSMDAIEKSNSGHPGLPLGMADVVTVLFSNYLKYNPLYPKWHDRDRFVLSAGHGSMLLYAIAYLTGYKDININQIKKFRQLGSKTAGHPEYGLLDCIETTTGPLGQGLANAVGMALSEKILCKKFGKSIVDHKTWALVGDGCLMEGISQEAISLAGHQKLKKLIVLFDDNGISIDGSTSLTTSDNHIKRFEASNWNTLKVDGHNFSEINSAFKKIENSTKPSLIAFKTIIGFGSPNKSGKSDSHGSPLGKNETKITKKALGINSKAFSVPENILKLWRKVGKRGELEVKKWNGRLEKNKLKKEFLNQFKKKAYKRKKTTNTFLSNIVKNNFNEATRKSSQNSIEFFSRYIDNFLGGSADLTGSNLTKVSSSKSNGKKVNYIYYGVREHLMAAAMNGISLHGGFIAYGGTFLIFSDYCKNSIRLSAIMKQRVIYVFTHDSIGLGEDGPTHQPIEQLEGLRSIPNLLVMRPCDAIETFECWEIAIEENKTPTALILSRQSLPLLRKKVNTNFSRKGAYFIKKNVKSKITFIATGSEVSLAKKVQDILVKKNIMSNLVSMPCVELFEKNTSTYKNKILGNNPRIIIEAASGSGWYKYLRENDLIFSMEKFGESGKAKELFEYFGFEENKIVKKILEKYFK